MFSLLIETMQENSELKGQMLKNSHGATIFHNTRKKYPIYLTVSDGQIRVTLYQTRYTAV